MKPTLDPGDKVPPLVYEYVDALVPIPTSMFELSMIFKTLNCSIVSSPWILVTIPDIITSGICEVTRPWADEVVIVAIPVKLV